MTDLAQLIEQAQDDLRALEQLDQATGKKNIRAQQLRRQLDALRKRLEANEHEQKAA